MRALRIGAVLVLAAACVLAALLATDVRSRQRAFVLGDAVYAVTPGRATWGAATQLGGGAAALLGTDDDLAFRRALQLYAKAASTPDRLDTAVELQTLRSEADAALAKAAHGSHASRAETLQGILAFAGTGGADAAIADFTNAVRADPGNTAAKFDLELLLRLTAAHGSRPGTSPGGSFGKGGRRGAGGGVPGSGY
jgi:hypothetical protein